MTKVIALDVGTKRTGVAETDPMQIIATGLTTVKTSELLSFLKEYVNREKPECLVIGQPKRLHGELGSIEGFIVELIAKIQKKHPNLPIERIDERFTLNVGLKKAIQKGKGEIYFNASDIFNTMVINQTIDGNEFKYTSFCNGWHF